MEGTGGLAMTHTEPAAGAFAASRACFTGLLEVCGGQDAPALHHAALEEQLAGRGRELLRQLFQDHLDLRASGKPAGMTSPTPAVWRISGGGRPRAEPGRPVRGRAAPPACLPGA